MPLTTNIRAQITCALTKAGDLGTGSFPVQLLIEAALASGTTDVQADKAWGDTRTLAPSATEDLDLAGVLFDPFGDAFTLAEVVAILIMAAAANTNNVIVGNHATAAFVGPFGAAAHTRAIKPGGFDFWYAPAGWPVTATTADLLKVLNSAGGTSVDYSAVIVGRSA